MATNNIWDNLTMAQKSDIMASAVRHGITSLQDIRDKWNEFAEGGEMPDTVGEYADAIYQNAVEEPYGDPSPHYNNVDKELMQKLTPDSRGHYDDAVKLPNHPSSPIRGTFNGNYFDLTDEGMQNPNYTLFGLIDNGDADTTLRYNGSYVLPEVTVTPEGNYYDDTYNNIRIMPWDSKILNQHAYGGHLFKGGGKVSQRNQRAGYAVDYFVNKGLSREQAAGLVGNLMRESSMNTEAVNPASGAYGLGQWLGERKTRLFKKYGNHPTFYNQLDYIWDELNSTHKKGLKMLKSSKTVDDAARNAFGYYEFSAGPEAAVAAMNRNGMKTKWKNPNGTVALNDGINNAWVAYGKASPKAKLGLNVKAPILGYQRQLPQFDFEGIGDEIADIGYNQPSSFNVSDALAQGLIPSNPTDYGTPVDYGSLIRTTEEPKEDEVFKDDKGMGLLTLMSNLGVFGEQQQEPLASYTPPKNNSPFVVSAPTYNDTLLDDSWFANGGRLFAPGGVMGNENEDTGISGAYDRFKNSTAGTVASFVPFVGTAMDGIEFIRHPSLENAAWFGLGLAGDLTGGKLLTSLVKGSGKKAMKKAVERGSNVYKDVHGNTIHLSPKAKATNDAIVTKLAAAPVLMEGDNVVQYLVDNQEPDVELANDTEFGYEEYDPADPPIGLIADYTKKYGKAEARKHFALDSTEDAPIFPERENNNTSSTAKASEGYEDLMRNTLINDYRNNNHISDRGYDIPFIPSKAITINGNLTSTNQLDSLAKYWGWHNANPQLNQTPSKFASPRLLSKNEMLGLAGQETMFGAVPIGNIGDDYGYTDREMSNANYLRAFGSIPAEYYVRDFNYNDSKLNLSTPPLLDAFRYYAQGDYNRGDKSHTSDVNAAGEAAWKLPSVQQWWNLSGKYWAKKGAKLGKK